MISQETPASFAAFATRSSTLAKSPVTAKIGSTTLIADTSAPRDSANANPCATPRHASSDPSVGMRMCRYMLHLPIRKRGRSEIQVRGPDFNSLDLLQTLSPALLSVVPDIGRELPVVAGLFPNHDILARHIFRGRTLGLQLERPDLPRSRRAERLDVERDELRVFNLFRHRFPHGADRGAAAHHRRAGRQCGRIISVKRSNAGKITFVKEFDPLRVGRLDLGLLCYRRYARHGNKRDHQSDFAHDKTPL